MSRTTDSIWLVLIGFIQQSRNASLKDIQDVTGNLDLADYIMTVSQCGYSIKISTFDFQAAAPAGRSVIVEDLPCDSESGTSTLESVCFQFVE